MPGSVIVLSSEPDLFDKLRRALAADTRFINTDNELHCDGISAPLTNIYAIEMQDAEWEDWEPAGSDMPDPRTLSHLIFECRSPEWIAEVGHLMAEKSDVSVWFVDSADVAWPAGRVDPHRVALT